MFGCIQAPLGQFVQRNQIGLVKSLGKVLFKDYFLPFELSSVLFLAAMVGAVMLGKKDIY
jgi:NADH-quinone oxidoreductase subunit J